VWLEMIAARRIREALLATEGNFSRACKMIGVTRRTAYQILRRVDTRRDAEYSASWARAGEIIDGNGHSMDG
jgi:DNA-binding NtrC family response regulator